MLIRDDEQDLLPPGITVDDQGRIIRYVMNFPPVVLTDDSTGKSYVFPPGHLALDYDTFEETFSACKVIEQYTHPNLQEIDAPEQEVPLSRPKPRSTYTIRDAVLALYSAYEFGLHFYSPYRNIAYRHPCCSCFNRFMKKDINQSNPAPIDG